MNTVIVNGVNITEELEELKRDVARYFELLRSEKFESADVDEYIELHKKLSKVGKKE